MANLDLSIAIGVFQEECGRAPRPTEMSKLRELTLATPYVVGAEEFGRAWSEYVTPPKPPTPEEEVAWDEFSLMGCLDR